MLNCLYYLKASTIQNSLCCIGKRIVLSGRDTGLLCWLMEGNKKKKWKKLDKEMRGWCSQVGMQVYCVDLWKTIRKE